MACPALGKFHERTGSTRPFQFTEENGPVRLTLTPSHSIDGVVVDAFERLCRTKKFSDLAILQPFQDRGAKIWTATQTFDFGQQQSLLLPGLHALIAGDELAKIRS